MSIRTLLTADEYLVLPDDTPSELVRGEIVEMSPPGPRHGRVCLNVGLLLELWARSSGLGIVITNDSAIRTEVDPDTVRGADVSYISHDRLPDGLPATRFHEPPNLCVEVLSPSNRWADVLQKISEYLLAGVEEVWIVDPVGRWVERHRAETTSERLVEGDDLADSPTLPGFTAPVGEFLRDV